MTITADINQLKNDIAARIEAAQKNRHSDKTKSAFVAIYLGVVSAITTVCIGIVSYLPSYSNLFGVISLLTSASVTVVAAWDGIFQHKKLWVHASKKLNELYELETDIRHIESKSNISQEQANEFYDRYKAIMKAANDRWYSIRE